MRSHRSPGATKDRLILFGRYPVPGRTKTRLIPFLGPAGAAELQRHLTEKAFQTAKEAAIRRGMALEICLDGGTPYKTRRWMGSWALHALQDGADLGQRMETAFFRAFHEGCSRVVLFGTDIPGLSASALDLAMDRLRDSDVVLGPSTDGGYWLIGLKKSADLFRGIAWSSEQVLSQTLDRAENLGLSIALLDPLTDVDTMEEVHKLLPDWEDTMPYLSVIIPALDEAEHIKEAVRHALCGDAEVMVVDGGSRDGTREAAVHAGARLLESQKGRGVQQNHGAEAARGRVLLFLHADTLLPEDYVNHIFETLLARKAVLGAFRFKTDLEKPLARVIEALVNFRSRHFRLPYGDQAFFVRKEVFEKTGGFPNVPIGEDFFFVKRLRRHGRIALANAFVTTSGRRWEKRGLLRTTWTNQVILAGLAMGISLSTLASIYGGKGLDG
jgi:rSAM/selenodomain-associated transferase 2/rSAM/selenodomain-associated transferase 1